MNIQWYPGELEKLSEAVGRALEDTGDLIVADLKRQQTVPYAEDPYKVAARKLGLDTPTRGKGRRSSGGARRAKASQKLDLAMNSPAKKAAVSTRRSKRAQLKAKAREMARRSKILPGELQASMFVDAKGARNGRVAVVTNTPYARRLYFHPEYNFYRGHNRQAGGEWYKPYLATRREWVAKAFSRALRRERS